MLFSASTFDRFVQTDAELSNKMFTKSRFAL